MAVGVIEIVVSGILGIITGIVGHRFFTSDCRIGTGSLQNDTATSSRVVPNVTNTSQLAPQPITVVVSDSMFAAAKKAQRDQLVNTNHHSSPLSTITNTNNDNNYSHNHQTPISEVLD